MITKFFLLPVFGMVAISASGCQSIYHLRGHRESNNLQPPGVTLVEGDAVHILTAGFDQPLISLALGYQTRSEDPEVVEVTGTGWRVYLKAKKPGDTRVHYDFNRAPGNRGFPVTVLPKSTRR